MTTPQFLALSTAGKKTFLQNTEHISERYEPDFTVLLYCVDGLYVEAFHHRRSGIIQIDCINNTEALKAYLPLPQAATEAESTQPLSSICDFDTATVKPQPRWAKRLSNVLQQIKGSFVSGRSVTHL